MRCRKARTVLVPDVECELIECPYCGHVAELEHWDVLLAEPGNVFCNRCLAEFHLPDLGSRAVKLRRQPKSLQMPEPVLDLIE